MDARRSNVRATARSSLRPAWNHRRRRSTMASVALPIVVSRPDAPAMLATASGRYGGAEATLVSRSSSQLPVVVSGGLATTSVGSCAEREPANPRTSTPAHVVSNKRETAWRMRANRYIWDSRCGAWGDSGKCSALGNEEEWRVVATEIDRPYSSLDTKSSRSLCRVKAK
jgi:hypothetical protein